MTPAVPTVLSSSGAGVTNTAWGTMSTTAPNRRAVWVVDYEGGTLYTLNPATGSVFSQVNVGTAPHFCSPTLSGNHAFVGTLAGVVAVDGA